MLQAQSVFILGIYEGEYPPQKPIKFFWYLGLEFSIVTKSRWLIQGGWGCIPTGTHSAPKLAILRSKIGRKKFHPPPPAARLRPHPPPPLQKATNSYE